MTDRGAGDTLLIHHRQACYAGALAPDARIVEDGRLHRLVDCLSTGFIRRQDGAMRTDYDDPTFILRQQ